MSRHVNCIVWFIELVIIFPSISYLPTTCLLTTDFAAFPLLPFTNADTYLNQSTKEVLICLDTKNWWVFWQ